MQRRTFPRNSAISLGTLSGMYSESLKAEGASPNPAPKARGGLQTWQENVAH